MSRRATVAAVFQQVAAEQGQTLVPLTDELPLMQSGLDSLSFALVVARLEDTLGIDPFSASDSVRLPVTFRDFVRLYEEYPLEG
jgi:Phosphopantetheine attachment site